MWRLVNIRTDVHAFHLQVPGRNFDNNGHPSHPHSTPFINGSSNLEPKKWQVSSEMSHSGKPRGTIDFGKAYDQQQSPLFTMLPLDIRRHIYLQLWRHYGTTQHIYLFSPNSYLSHYPCLLEKDAFNHYRPSSPAPPEPEGPAEAAAEAGVPNFGVIDQPGSHDDPGDIDGAIQDLAALQPQPQPDVSGGMSDGVHNWNDSPWCMHEKCFRDYIGVFNMSFERAYSRNYKRAARSVTSEVGITKPLLVCKKMYTEASESLYSKIAFSFPDMVALERFINDVPRSLIERIPAVDVSYFPSLIDMSTLVQVSDWLVMKITTTITADGEGLSWEARSLCIQDSGLPPLSAFCTKLKLVLSNVQSKSNLKLA